MNNQNVSNSVGRLLATTVVVIIALAIVGILAFSLVARWKYREERALFTLGEGAYPVVGPLVGAFFCGVVALNQLTSLRRAREESSHMAEWITVRLSLAILGMIFLLGVSVYRVLV